MRRAVVRGGPGARGVRIGLVVLAVVAYPALVGFGDSPEARNRKGNAYYKEGRYDEALTEYRNAQVLSPELRELSFNAGDALYMKGDLPNAVKEFGVASAADDSLLAASAFYNAGNAFLKMGDIENAIESYRAALIENPSDADAKFNLELALRLLDEQKRQEQNTGGGKSGDESERDQNEQEQGDQEQNNEGEQQQSSGQEEGGQGDQQELSQPATGEQEPQGEEQEAAMTSEDAERLLDAIEQAERELQAKVRSARAKKRVKVEKDW